MTFAMTRRWDGLPEATTPYALEPGGGAPLWFLNALHTVKAAGEQTGGAYALIEALMPPEFGPPAHVHANEDEAFYVLEGGLTVTCGDQMWQAAPGAFVLLPRGIPHGLTTLAGGPTRALVLTTPSGFERFNAEVGEPAARREIPPPQPPDLAKLAARAARYGIGFVPPLPG